MKVKKISHQKYNYSSVEEHNSSTNENISMNDNSLEKSKNYPQTEEFEGVRIFVGLDVHKKSWSVAIIADGVLRERFTQEASCQTLCKHLHRRYPGGEYYSVYEAGFCGFWIYRQLNQLGINCIVVNAADIPTKDKERKNKTDRVDAAKLARELSAGSLEKIYVPGKASLGARLLIRTRTQCVAKITRCKNQIKGLLNFHGINTPEDLECRHWSRQYLEFIKGIEFPEKLSRTALDSLLKELLSLRSILLDLNKEIRNLSKNKEYKEDSENLLSIYGVNTIAAMTLLSEIDNIGRFRNLDSLCKYVGLVPSESSSGQTQRTGPLTRRKNNRLRQIIVEISWVAARYDQSINELFLKYQKRMPKKKAIIKIGRHILNRIRFILKTKQKYRQLAAL